MKRFVCIIIASFMALTLCACHNDIPKGYVECEEFFENDAIMDHTDFAMYVYPSAEVFEKNLKLDLYELTEDDEADIELVKDYISFIEEMLESGDRADEFKFDYDCIGSGDLVKLNTREGQKETENSTYGKYDDFDMYFFDKETLTLYFFHNDN